MATAGALVALFAASFLPPLFFALRLRNAERHRREPWQGLAKAFLWGAFGATFLAFLAEAAIFPFIPGGFEDQIAPWTLFSLSIATIVVAPIVEESAKGLGLLYVRDEDPEPEDGLIYGGMMGLGFAATENALYIALAAMTGGQELAIATAVYRSVATVSLHAVASAILGYGVWRARYGGMRGAGLMALLGAILLHGAYNAVASIQLATAALAAGLLAIFAYWRALRQVKRLDRGGAEFPPGNL